MEVRTGGRDDSGRIDSGHLPKRADVTHGLVLLGTHLYLMVVPSVVKYARVKFEKPRVYQLLCHEFVGPGMTK